ncbi:MAG TPA: PadR family transcriptional regulator [Gaiellaceae bacterium]|jgi:DNA-binding PadR family transcriptional regulator
MSNPSLTPVAYLVLGLVARGETTPYDLKRKVAGSIGYFWSFPHSQLYAEPARLTELGLLHEEREEQGRRRRVYSISDAGRRALEDWLRRPTSEPPQMRDTGLLKLFFGDALDRDEIVALARAEEKSHRQRLAVYEQLDETVPTDPALVCPRRTLQAGLRCERAFVEFWAGVAADPPAV